MQITSSISKRSLAIGKQFVSTEPHASKALKDPWTDSNPTGNIVMTVAENRRFSERFAERLHKCAIWASPVIEDLHYNQSIGVHVIREAIARHVNQYVLAPGKFPIDASQVVTGNGVLPLLENLVYAVADAGDGVLVISPFWHGFNYCLTVRMGVNVIVVPTDSSTNWWPSENALDKALQEAKYAGVKCTAILVCNPSNPLGKVFSEEQLLSTIRWGTSQGLHIICDEIYAATVFNDTVRFVSAWDIASEHLGPEQQQMVHILWGPSKDFGVPGLRIGAIFSKSSQILNVLTATSFFAMTSTPMQRAVAEILSDSTFVSDFMRETVAHLKKSCESFTAELRRCDIKYIAPSAGLFIVLDLRRLLPSRPTFEDELVLFNKLCNAGVVITPAKDCHFFEPGLFRACPYGLPQSCYCSLADRIAGFH